jgi:hypothetical protein
MAGFAYAAAIDITIYDDDGKYVYNNAPGSDPWEDEEVQSGMQTGQEWDLEGMFLEGNTLSLVGGWNFESGEAAGAWSSYVGDYWDSGDIFISVGATPPKYGSTALGSGNETTMSWYGYDYVLDVDWGSGTYVVYTTGGSEVELVFFDGTAPAPGADNTEANPWRYDDGGTQLGGTQLYTTGGTLGTDAGFLGGTHNQVNFDLSWLAAALGGTDDYDLWFHFTQECGNDNLMGNAGSYNLVAPPPVPEPASIGLLGLGLVGLVTARIRTKRA